MAPALLRAGLPRPERTPSRHGRQGRAVAAGGACVPHGASCVPPYTCWADHPPVCPPAGRHTVALSAARTPPTRPRPVALRRRGAPCAPTSPVRGPRIWGTVPHTESRHIRDLGLVAESAAHVTPPTAPPGPQHSAARRVGASSRSSWNGIGRSEGRIAERVPRFPSPLKCPGHVQYDGPCQLIDGVTGEKGFRARSKTGR